MKKTDKIAILLATYNGETYLSEQLESILQQSSQKWKVFIHDDGSNDRSMQIIAKYIEHYPELFCYIEGNRQGNARDNFFYLLSQVEAPYYMFCDQDDVWRPDKVEITHSKMLEIENNSIIPCLAFTELEVIDKDGAVICESMSQYQGLDCTNTSINRLLMQNVVSGCTMEINYALRTLGLEYQNSQNIIMHDWWLALIAAAFGRIEFIEAVTIGYRQHDANSVGALDIHSKKYLMKRIWQGKNIKKSLYLTRIQAGEFAKCIDGKNNTIASKYANIGERGKLRRCFFYLKNDMKKTNLSRNIGLILWG